MKKDLPTLPIGQANFTRLRESGRLYVDKTALLEQLIVEGDYYFLSRPRRFGKSLTVSTLEAMFKGRAELFSGLAAEAWVLSQASHPSPVLSLDLSSLGSLLSQKKINQGLALLLTRFARQYGIDALPQEDSDLLFSEVLERVSEKYGPVAVLIDEYDSPMLNYLEDTAKVQCFRNQLRSFFLVLKSCSQYLRFVFITGISKFTKAGIFSALNNLRDISTDKNYSTLTGYTQAELENNFSLFIADAVQQKVALSKTDLLQKIRKFYDGFCFDGQTKVYNPFSLLNFFCSYRFSSYWYDSGSVSFIEKYFKTHQVESPENYHHIKVDETLLAPREIEEASPESFLYQAGYLTIVKWTDEYIILDYPNQEVLCSLSKMYLSRIYQIANYAEVGKRLWQAVESADIVTLVREYNAALASLPYQDFGKTEKESKKSPGESFYRALFLMLLRGCGLQAKGEIPSCRGRSDVVITMPERILVIEFKLAKNAQDITKKLRQGEEQINAQGYLEPYATGKIPVSSAVFVVDAQKRQIVTRTEQSPKT